VRNKTPRTTNLTHLLGDEMKDNERGQLLLVTCVLLAISILTIAKITSTGIYFEEDDPYDDGNTDVVLAETQASFFHTFSARFNAYNFSGVADEKKVIHTLFNDTSDLFSTIGARNGELLFMDLQDVNETSPGTFNIQVYFSLKEQGEKAAMSSDLWLTKP